MAQEEIPKLPQAFEALLSAWPVPARDELDWEGFAASTVARAVAEGESHPRAAVEELLAAPQLVPEPGEPAARPPSKLKVADSDSRSLKEIALASLESDAGNDGATDLALVTLGEFGRERQSRPSYPEVPRTSQIRATAGIPAVVPGPGAQPEPKPAPDAPAQPQPGGGGRTGWWLAALAAAGVLVWFGFLRTPEAHNLAEAPPAPPKAVPASDSTAIRAEPQPASAASARAAVEQQAGAQGSPELAPAPSAGVDERLAHAAPKAARGSAAEATAPAPQPAAPTSAQPPSAPEEIDDPRLVPAAKPENVPLEPSTGAALAAVGRVMGGAKACVAGQTGPSTATLTFRSDGTVASVGITGPAAGKPAEACIRSALMGARVAPFAKPSFSIRVPIRP